LAEVEDMGEVKFRHDNGAISSIHLNYFQQPPRHDLEIIGTKGTIRWNNADGICRWWTTETRIWQTHVLPEEFDRNDLFTAEMSHFIEMIKNGIPSSCTLEDGLAVQKIISAILG
jgi:predicted dehydrogenase